MIFIWARTPQGADLRKLERQNPGLTTVGTIGIESGRRSESARTNRMLNTAREVSVRFSATDIRKLTFRQRVPRFHVFRSAMFGIIQGFQYLGRGNELVDCSEHVGFTSRDNHSGSGMLFLGRTNKVGYE